MTSRSTATPWRTPSTTADGHHQDVVFSVTHPFHPWRGRTCKLESYRRAWGEQRVYFYDKDGRLQQLPASWTDVEGGSPFVDVAAGRAHFRFTELLDLAQILERLEKEERCSM